MAVAGPDIKVVLLGRHNAGKTCLVDRFVNEKHSAAAYQTTIGAAFAAKRVDVGTDSVIMGIWDTAGSERYEALSKMFYRGAWAAIICFDLTDEDSFERVKFWMAELKTNEENCKIYLCGTKKDKVEVDKANRQVDFHTAREFADENGGEYVETSSITGENVGELFLDIAKAFVNSSSYRTRKNSSRIILRKTGNVKKKRWGCC
ncbi:ras-related protein Rab-24-like isoform X2 [Paramacrobiotus metropolitanus]|uniref:ras-related protein Rab-24-like isoform X2 n=1 Tax=Paramacrobiotus metropolitanus TaxID=2943436 RepID=UPI0024464765|nr:ras-related protein Rab-24-like isoform X2 [Paramacrobiotus metropolitanus]